MVLCLPLSVVPVVFASAEVYSSQGLHPVSKTALYGLCAVGFGFIAQYVLNSWHGNDMLECLLFGCIFEYDPSLIAKEKSLPNGFYPTLGKLLHE